MTNPATASRSQHPQNLGCEYPSGPRPMCVIRSARRIFSLAPGHLPTAPLHARHPSCVARCSHRLRDSRRRSGLRAPRLIRAVPPASTHSSRERHQAAPKHLLTGWYGRTGVTGLAWATDLFSDQRPTREARSLTPAWLDHCGMMGSPLVWDATRTPHSGSCEIPRPARGRMAPVHRRTAL